MRNFILFWLLVGSSSANITTAQAVREPFQAIWDFNNSTLTGVSNRTSVVASSVGTVGVNVPGLQNVAYPASPAPGAGQYVNFQNWQNAGACNGAEYIEVTLSPQGGKDFTITSVSFLVSSSGSGPRTVIVTSSVTGFNVVTPLITSPVTQSGTPFSWQLINIPLTTVPGYKNVTTPITFRISACQATGTGSTLRIDNLNINGDILLPADLISFTARVDNQQVRLDWATSWERNTDQFVVETSTDGRYFQVVGAVTAAGTSDQRQLYSLTHETPAPGPNYYRLLQLDADGSARYSNLIAAIVPTNGPALSVMPNPADSQQLALRFATATDAPDLTVWDALGRKIMGRLLMQSDTEAVFLPDCPLAPGTYWLRLLTPTGPVTLAVLVR